MLIEIKKHEKTGISKRALSDITGINHNSIVKWRNQYNKEGISPLLTHGRVGGFRKSILSDEEHKRVEVLLNDPKNGIKIGRVQVGNSVTNTQIVYSIKLE